jgi:hypothetical protein
MRSKVNETLPLAIQLYLAFAGADDSNNPTLFVLMLGVIGFFQALP